MGPGQCPSGAIGHAPNPLVSRNGSVCFRNRVERASERAHNREGSAYSFKCANMPSRILKQTDLSPNSRPFSPTPLRAPGHPTMSTLGRRSGGERQSKSFACVGSWVFKESSTICLGQ